MLRLEHRYALLPEHFYARLNPVPVHAPKMLKFNHSLARELDLDIQLFDSSLGAEIFSGNQLPEDSMPIAMAYAGHQFGNFVPQLGDGRAILLGEITDIYGQLRDIHLKGSGQTPFSRQGDGRATLGAVLREYMISEAMHALGIPTTRSLAVVTTGESVYRATPLPGAILTRVAASHIRIGTFEYFAAQGDYTSVKILADYAIERHYPALKEAPHPYLGLLESVLEAQASLVAKWMQIGFIHGVMNTDNMLISGESIDYGPCAFMDTYDPKTVFSSIDRHGRYRWNNQAQIAQWNLTRLAETLLPLLDVNETIAIDQASQVINTFTKKFEQYWLKGMQNKLGLLTAHDDDLVLIQALLDLMHQEKSDYTHTFYELSHVIEGKPTLPAYEKWMTQWLNRLSREKNSPRQSVAQMRAVNPSVIPRNTWVEEAIAAALNHDLSKFNQLIMVLSTPFDSPLAYPEYQTPPALPQRPYQTFCGT